LSKQKKGSWIKRAREADDKNAIAGIAQSSSTTLWVEGVIL
jgi:hypothetical protein